MGVYRPAVDIFHNGANNDNEVEWRIAVINANAFIVFPQKCKIVNKKTWINSIFLLKRSFNIYLYSIYELDNIQ